MKSFLVLEQGGSLQGRLLQTKARRIQQEGSKQTRQWYGRHEMDYADNAMIAVISKNQTKKDREMSA